MPLRTRKNSRGWSVHIRDKLKLKRVLEIWEAQSGESSFSSWVHHQMNKFLEEHDNSNQKSEV